MDEGNNNKSVILLHVIHNIISCNIRKNDESIKQYVNNNEAYGKSDMEDLMEGICI